MTPSPTDALVLTNLRTPKTASTLAAEMHISKRTVRYKIRRLKEQGRIRETANLQDMRSPKYVAIAGGNS